MRVKPVTILSFVFFLLILVQPALAQQATISGFVTDAIKEQPLQGATVVLTNDDGFFMGESTDGDGYFILHRIPSGTYTLRVSFIGFTNHEASLDITGTNILDISIILQASEEELDELVVEAESESGVTAVAAGLESIVPAQIERVPMPGVTGDLASYLQTMPGVTVQGDRGGQFFVRGGALDQNLAMLDGMPIYMPFHVLSFYSSFPEEIIDNAQVYTGGFGARYATRISSIIDVKARKGNKQNLAGSVSVAPFLSTFRIEGPLVKNRVSFIGSVRHSLIEQIMPTMLGQDLPYHFGDQFGKLHAFINPNHSVSFTFLNTFDRGDIAGTKKSFEGNAESTPPNDSSEVAWNNTVFGGKYTYLSNFLPLLAEVSVSLSEMTNEMGPRDARERTSGIESLDAKADFTYFLKENELRFGVAYKDATLSYELGGQFQGIPEVASSDLLELSAYLETDLSFAKGLVQLEPGVQFYQLPDYDNQWFDPRARLTLLPPWLDSRIQLNAAWGVYHQAIAGLNDERDIGNLFTAWLPIPQDSPVPRSVHTIIGANVQITPWLKAAAEAFQKSYDNLSVPVFSPLPSFTTALQQADGLAQGVDIRLDLQNRPFWYGSVLDGYVSYANAKVEYETATVSYTPAHDRRHQINALLHAQKDEVGLTVQFQYGTGLPFTQSSGFDVWLLLTPDTDVTTEPGVERIVYGAPFKGRQPDYQRVDIWLERRIDRGRSVVTMRAGALNIFNRDNLFYYDLFTFKRIDQLPFIPSVGLKVELR